jgi:hypothetical protein
MTVATPFTPYHLADTKLSVEPLHLSVTLTHPAGNTSNLHVVHDADLGVSNSAGEIALEHAERARVVVALGVDDDHDEVLFQDCGGVGSSLEVLQEAIEALQTAMSAIERIPS